MLEHALLRLCQTTHVEKRAQGCTERHSHQRQAHRKTGPSPASLPNRQQAFAPGMGASCQASRNGWRGPAAQKCIDFRGVTLRPAVVSTGLHSTPRPADCAARSMEANVTVTCSELNR